MPYLVVENGNLRGQRVEIPKGGKATFGRDPRAEIAVTDHLCSRRHFEVEEVDGCYVLRDLGSSNGTYVNDQRVTAPTDLTHGDCILAGESQITFLEETGGGAAGSSGRRWPATGFSIASGAAGWGRSTGRTRSA
jgi:pSer/pThr/pTyr-binding forkhead associated (FHA) protein